MNRREFSLQLAGAAGVAALSSLGLAGRALASTSAPVEGTDYHALKTPLSLPKTGKVEVIEFFWYGCPHCYAFEPMIEPWIAKLPADVAFRRVPAAFNARWEFHQQIYCTWEAMGVVDKMHAKTFDRFHKAGKPIDKLDDLLAFARESGLDAEAVKKAWNNFAVSTKMAQDKQLVEAYRVDGVPTIGVNGRYTTEPSLGGPAACLATTDTLIAQMRKVA
jgi:protein dithiol oxidoreductase (disulfide-forming)